MMVMLISLAEPVTYCVNLILFLFRNVECIPAFICTSCIVCHRSTILAYIELKVSVVPFDLTLVFGDLLMSYVALFQELV